MAEAPSAAEQALNKLADQAEILAAKKPVVQQIEGMTAELKPDTLALVEQADLKFTATTELTPACKQFGKVYAHPVSSEKCHATGKGLEMATVGEQATVTLYLIDKEGKDYNDQVVDVTCELMSCTSGTSVKGSVKKGEGNRYDISYQPTRRGRHQLHIKVEGQHIRGSPFSVVALGEYGTPTKTIGGLKEPRGVMINERGQIIVVEEGADCISILDASGSKLKTIPTEGSLCEGNIFRCGIAIDDGGNILVADIKQHGIRKYVTGDRVTSSVIGTKGRRPLQFNHPSGISVHPQSKKVFVCDCENNRVQILNSDLTYFNYFGWYGRDDREFYGANDVTFDSAGNVYVADIINNRVQVLTEDGQFLRKFGKGGTGDGELNRPNAIAIDSDDIVYVTELNNNRVSVFTCQGQFLRSFGSKGTAPGQFDGPKAIAVDRDGLVYVCDYHNNRIQIF